LAERHRGTSLQQVKVFTNEGLPLSTIKYHDGFLGQRIGPISSLAFHPHQMLMAVGSTDALVSVFTSAQGPGAAS
jgi:regulatory associated protein of mTOR